MSIGGREDEHQRAPDTQPSGHQAGADSFRSPAGPQMSISTASAGHQLAADEHRDESGKTRSDIRDALLGSMLGS